MFFTWNMINYLNFFVWKILKSLIKIKNYYSVSERFGNPDWIQTDESLKASLGWCVHLGAEIAILKRYLKEIIFRYLNELVLI